MAPNTYNPIHLLGNGILVSYYSNTLGGPYVLPGTPVAWSSGTAGAGSNVSLILQTTAILSCERPTARRSGRRAPPAAESGQPRAHARAGTLQSN
jgi:hypothetical protein